MPALLSPSLARYLVPLSPPAQQAVMSKAHAWQAAPGEVIFRQQDVVPAIWLLDAGQVRFVADLASGRGIVSAWASAGHCVGELEVLGQRPAISTAIAAEPCAGWRLPAATVDRLLDEVPEFSRLLMKTLAHGAQLSHLLYQHALLLPPVQRLALALLNLAQAADDADGRPVLRVDLTQEALAELVAGSRQFVGKYLRQWAQQGWTARRYGWLEITDRRGLLSVLETGLDPVMLALLAPR